MAGKNKLRCNVISLGCSKNLIDAERVMCMISGVGYHVEFEQSIDDGPFDTVVINTCGFIGDAKEQSVNTILEWTQAKENGMVRRVYVMGCLSERYRQELPPEIQEVDGWYGKFDWPDMVRSLTRERPAVVSYDRIITTAKHHAYLKISEGCNRFCAFCAIPLITGRFRSRPIEELVEETRMLVSRGVKEINVIAQELTAYGEDIYGRKNIGELIDALAGVEGVEWIRLHYAYPSGFPDELLDAMARNSNVCRYLDIALQHINDKVLSNMRRHINAAGTRELLKRIRERVPGIHIRTTLMVGFPGEDESAFNELKEFVESERFERMGAFAYCEEEDTYSARHFKDDIPESEKQRRLDEIMEIQQRISEELQAEKIGKTFRVIIDRKEGDYYIGRTEFDSPEVDPEVLVKSSQTLCIGEFYDVLITGSTAFELMGTI